MLSLSSEEKLRLYTLTSSIGGASRIWLVFLRFYSDKFSRKNQDASFRIRLFPAAGS